MTSNFKRALTVLAVAAVALFAARGALAQTQATTANVQNGLTSYAAIAPGALTVNTMPAYPVTSADLNQHVHTNQAAEASSSFSTPAQWRCATSGEGFAVQAVWGGVTHSGKGGESVVCAADFRIALVKSIDAMPDDDEKAIARRIACNDDEIADAWERVHPCTDPAVYAEERKARWANEKNQRSMMAQ